MKKNPSICIYLWHRTFTLDRLVTVVDLVGKNKLRNGSKLLAFPIYGQLHFLKPIIGCRQQFI